MPSMVQFERNGGKPVYVNSAVIVSCEDTSVDGRVRIVVVGGGDLMVQGSASNLAARIDEALNFRT